MSIFKNWRTLSFIIWIVVAVMSVITMPDLAQLVRDKGQIEIPNHAQSKVAQSMINNMEEDGGESYQIIAVYNSGSEHALTVEQRKQIKSSVEKLKDQEKQLGITNVVSHLDNEETEKQFVSEDGTTILTQIAVDKEHGTITEVVDELEKVIQVDGVKTYLTGNALVVEDFVQSTEAGVKKTEAIAVIFIIVVLIAIFRSPIVPFISLFTVGVSYVVSLSIIAHFVEQFNYPFSNFTQVFLIVILFGIGTDYNILLYTRFKEELTTQSPLQAVSATIKSAGSTVFYSGIAVFIGFIVLLMAEFKLYQAMSAVAIGVAVLILVLITLNPFFMALLGKKMFWPVKRFEGHGDSRIWAFLSRYSVLRPIAAILFVAVLSVPFLLHFTGTLNYNDLVEVDDTYASKQGINVIEEHFSPGFSSPATLMIHSNQPLDNQRSLQSLDELAEKISKVDGVASVYTPTRPAGEKIKELYINEQTSVLNNGLGDANSGIGEINEGLSSAEGQISQGDSNGIDNVQTLINGTNEVKNGLTALEDALNQVTDGFNHGTRGAKDLEEGLNSVNENLDTVSNATSQLVTGYTKLADGLSSYSSYFVRVKQAVDGTIQGYEAIDVSMSNLMEKNPELVNDPDVQRTIQIATSAIEQLRELSTQIEQLSSQHDSVMSSFREANASLEQVNAGLGQIKKGVEQLQTGASDLKEGLSNGTESSTLMASKTSELGSGVEQINEGQKQLLTGLNDLEEKMGLLQSGLSKSTKGLKEVNTGLSNAQDYLTGLSESQAAEKFYIPQDALESEKFQEGLDQYMSADRKTAQMVIILDVNPYSLEAMSIIREIDEQVEGAVKGSDLSDAQIAIGGLSSTNADLQDISSNDFMRTATIMLVGIGLVLVVITRSILQPLFIIVSLVLAYGASLGLSEAISANVLDAEYLSWNVPFFGFIMIVALGVDYSIFLMMRYREYKDADNAKGIVQAARHIGGVVISAAIILGGTFAALIPSGVITLIQVATVVIVGLILLSLVMLPIFIPALIGLVHKQKRESKE
ncbi:MMPL family transporter [Halalkalibacterium ligniniphilum]|uniref:MMPL family transporter n=1 Tax=Halalkalibacterium ligniniphilum TaxID=1134413 RepID=UPI00034712CA|nr:MMPL family transporter [Halalkalibacterium ligniniphilum]